MITVINLLPYYIATQSKMCKHRDGGEGEEEGEICTPQPSPLDRRINTMRGKSNKLNDMTEAKRSMSLMAEMIGMIVALGRKMTDHDLRTCFLGRRRQSRRRRNVEL